MHCIKATEPSTDAFSFRKRVPWMFFIIIQLPSHAQTGCAIMVSIMCRALLFLPCTNQAPIEQLNVEGHPFFKK
jgi:hypothetical protein